MLLWRERCSPKALCRLGVVSRTQTPSETPLLESWTMLLASASWKDGPAASIALCSIGGLAAGHYRTGQGYMPTRYRPALAGEETNRQGEEMCWKGMGMMASVCTTIGRLTFRRFSGRWTRRLCRPALAVTLDFNKPQTFDDTPLGRRHQNNRRGPPEPLPICTPTCLAYQAAYQGKHYCCYVLTHLHVATNKRRRLLEQALFCSSAARHKNPTLPPNHCIHTHCLPHPVPIIEHGLIQCPRIDPPVSAGETEPLAVKVHKRQRDQAAGA